MMGHGSGVLLIAAAVGYLVLERADKHKNSLRRAGQLVGWSIIIVSFLSMLCGALCAGGGRGSCDMMGMRGGHRGKTMCPFSGKSPAPAPASSDVPTDGPSAE